MNEEQIELLRLIIRGEIEAATRNTNLLPEASTQLAYEQKKLNEKRWREFNDSFKQ